MYFLWTNFQPRTTRTPKHEPPAPHPPHSIYVPHVAMDALVELRKFKWSYNLKRHLSLETLERGFVAMMEYLSTRRME